MASLFYQGGSYECNKGETVIDVLLRHGVNVQFSCRNGICQVCLQRCTSGSIPQEAQAGLKFSLREIGYFLPCKCIPKNDMELAPLREEDLFSSAVVYKKEFLAPDVCRLLLEPATTLSFRAGQFINLRRPDGLARSYSLAGIPEEDYFLELHVKRIAGGELSSWIFDELREGDELEIQGPQGTCCYVESNADQSLLMIGGGTGLAPLIGVARDALNKGHRGRIHLYHGSQKADGLYLDKALKELDAQYPCFSYTACVSGGEASNGYVQGTVVEAAIASATDLSGWRVYIAGSPDMVHEAERQVKLAGVLASDIHADPFVPKELRARPRASTRRYSPPDPEMWGALKQGVLLTEILTDFYTQVYDDERLAGFFVNVTRQRIIEKQYSFLHQVFTGKKVYFGDRPRNAHHWMVISDELFDYRGELLESCMRKAGLAEHLVERWQAIEEGFRQDIVKSEPWPRMLDGVALPLDGFKETTLSIGSICDGCQSEVAEGETVRYHTRIGKIYCSDCVSTSAKRPANSSDMATAEKASK